MGMDEIECNAYYYTLQVLLLFNVAGTKTLAACNMNDLIHIWCLNCCVFYRINSGGNMNRP